MPWFLVSHAFISSSQVNCITLLHVNWEIVGVECNDILISIGPTELYISLPLLIVDSLMMEAFLQQRDITRWKYVKGHVSHTILHTSHQIKPIYLPL